jgi:hypothetical protein
MIIISGSDISAKKAWTETTAGKLSMITPRITREWHKILDKNGLI